ncbi:MAG: hypothetical protein IJL74_01850 [Bacilli bacterium]|nr:hypothetical protein [Bacilli bacterium]
MYQKYIGFLKEYNLYDEEVLDYIKDKIIYIDYKKESFKEFVGCYPMIDNGIVKDIRLCIPKITDDISIAINIHEYVHLLKMHKYLDKEYVFKKDEEVLPVFYEMLFLVNNQTKETDEYIEFYRTYIENNNNKEYIYALKIWDSVTNQSNCKILKREY